ncbi:hypothetical protein [Pseudovibrio denitrificans]|uniref:hypothetical protein n=1 Tax=Pseudovibrio denitrificans TaxID=258256 RepID=UPI000AC334A8|nr:hypothetical protein [Pseudovibrio denitrificans]
MTVAAVGWGIYSIIGRGAANPLKDTGMNFLYAIPLVALALLLFPDNSEITLAGVVLAVISGAITSGLGYASGMQSFRSFKQARLPLLSSPYQSSPLLVGLCSSRKPLTCVSS